MTSRLDLRQPLMLSLVLLTALVVASYWLGTNPAVNLWSLQYLHSRNSYEFTSTHFETPPALHNNGYLWQARAALTDGMQLQASNILRSSSVKQSADTRRLWAEIEYAQNNFTTAIAIWSSDGDIDSLLAAGEKLLPNHPKDAIAAYEAAYRIRPERVALPLSRALLNSHNQNKNAAQAILEHAIRTYPASRFLADWFMQLGVLYRNDQSFDEAAATFTQLITLMPDNIQGWVQLGWVLYEQGNGYKAALEQFQHGIARNPNEGDGYLAVANLLVHERRFGDADLWYVNAIKREPNQKQWYLARAEAAQQAEDYRLSLAIFAHIEQTFPEYIDGNQRAMIAYRKNNDQESALAAAEHLQQLLATTMIDNNVAADYLTQIGQIYLWAKQENRAIIAFDEAIKRNPTQQEANTILDNLGK